MVRSGASRMAIEAAILVVGVSVALLILSPVGDYILGGLERPEQVGGHTAIEVLAASGLGSDRPVVYVRNLGPRGLELGSRDRPRDPSLWQVLIDDEPLEVVEVEERGRQDNVLRVDETIALTVRSEEGKFSSPKEHRVVVHGPGATWADPSARGRLIRPKEGEEPSPEEQSPGGGGFASRSWNTVKRAAGKAWAWAKDHKEEIAIVGTVAAIGIAVVATGGLAGAAALGAGAAGGGAAGSVAGSAVGGLLSSSAPALGSLLPHVLTGMGAVGGMYAAHQVLKAVQTSTGGMKKPAKPPPIKRGGMSQEQGMKAQESAARQQSVRRVKDATESPEHKKAVDDLEEFSKERGGEPVDLKSEETKNRRKAFHTNPDYEDNMAVYEGKRSVDRPSHMRNIVNEWEYAKSYDPTKELYLGFDNEPVHSSTQRLLRDNFEKARNWIYKKRPEPWKDLSLSLKRRLEEVKRIVKPYKTPT